MPEVWRTIEYPGYERYEVSNRGTIRSKEAVIVNKSGITQRINACVLKPRTNKIEPHLFVELQYTDDFGDKHRKTVYVHKCVMEHFGKKPGKNEVYVELIDMNYSNNHISNLRWISHKEMVKRNKALGLLKPNYELYKHSIPYKKAHGLIVNAPVQGKEAEKFTFKNFDIAFRLCGISLNKELTEKISGIAKIISEKGENASIKDFTKFL